MNDRFMRALSMAPVIDPNDHDKLHARVEKIVAKLSAAGEDPLTRMKMCQSYIADRICYMKQHRGKKSWIMMNTDPRRVGTYAWLNYMLDQTTKIIGILADRKLQSAMNA